jgi:hypothetical protein
VGGGVLRSREDEMVRLTFTVIGNSTKQVWKLDRELSLGNVKIRLHYEQLASRIASLLRVSLTLICRV